MAEAKLLLGKEVARYTIFCFVLLVNMGVVITWAKSTTVYHREENAATLPVLFIIECSFMKVSSILTWLAWEVLSKLTWIF